MSRELVVSPKETIWNPSPDELRVLVAKMPEARRTEYGSYCIGTKVVSRSKGSTFVVTDDPKAHSGSCITRQRGDEVARIQDAYIQGRTMIVLDGFIGCDPVHRTATRLVMEAAFANIAAMQQQLFFAPTAAELASFTPELNVVYTPGLLATGFPNDRMIAVDLEENITRVLNSDYFGESKKGGLRMWNKLIYDRGGLAMHAGCKTIPVGSATKTALIIGLSGTGKTTTTFTRQNDSRPIQDDFIALMPDGKVLATEDGCFAKTYELSAEAEPLIHRAVTRADAYLENVSIDAQGRVNFFDDNYTQNGRATFSFAHVPEAGDTQHIPPVDFILILNRNTNVIPPVARLSRTQAAAFFMLGETQGTSAGGAEEAGKALRIPGTNPFFPLEHGLQGSRFLELAHKLPFEVYLMNTGWVGGGQDDQRGSKVRIAHSSAIVKAIAERTIDWGRDPIFGYEVATHVPGISGPDNDELLLEPARYYESQGRKAEYQALADKYQSERRAHLSRFTSLDAAIVDAVSG